MTQLDPIDIVQPLQDNCPLFARRVFESINGDVDISTHNTPLALVYVTEDSSTDNPLVTAVSQRHHYKIAVKIAVRKTADKDDRLGYDNSRLLRDCRMEVIDALVGLIPNGCDYPVLHDSGELSSHGLLHFWTVNFTTADYLRP